jgi:L-lysine 6-transaminase
MVRFTKYLEIIEEENLVENSATVGAHLLKKLHALAADFPRLISNPRGRGLMCAVTVGSHTDRDRILKQSYADGLIILGCGDSSIRFRPALNITTDEIDEGMAIIRQALSEIEEEDANSVTTEGVLKDE